MRWIPGFLLSVSFLSLPAFGAHLPLEGIFLNPAFRGHSLSQLKWAADGNSLTFLQASAATGKNEIWRLSSDGSRSLQVPASELTLAGKPFSIEVYQPLPDGKSFLFTGLMRSRGEKPGGKIVWFNGNTRQLIELTKGENQGVIQVSPDGKKVGFVRDNNLFVLDIASGKEAQLTSDGTKEIRNGDPDWVYEEEFGLLTAWKWAPDSQAIAFLQLDESPVPTYPYYIDYSTPRPKILWMKYPKAGDANSKVRLGVVKVEPNPSVKWFSTGQGDWYLARFSWNPSSQQVLVQKVNRAQNELSLLACEGNGNCRTVLTEKEEGWVNVQDDLRFSDDGGFLWTSDRDGYRHLYHYSGSGQLRRRLTDGNWTIQSVVGLRGNEVFFLSNRDNAAETHLYSIPLAGGTPKRLTQEAGTHSVMQSPGGKYLVDTFSNVTTPTQWLLSPTGHSHWIYLEKNPIPELAAYEKSTYEFRDIPNRDGTLMHSLLIKPAHFDVTKRHPVILNPYGGPGAVMVKNRWRGLSGLWEDRMTSLGYVFAVVDNRGTGGRGKAFETVTKGKLGFLESEDQIDVARFLREQIWVDPARIGMFGGSFGGFLTALTLCRGGDLFKAGVAVSSVTDWRYYDSIYTERYMGMPDQNAEGYRVTSPIQYASGLTAHLLLMHGTADDNVHWQNTDTLMKALLSHGKSAEMELFPAKSHSLSEGKYTTMRFYTRLAQFFEKWL